MHIQSSLASIFPDIQSGHFCWNKYRMILSYIPFCSPTRALSARKTIGAESHSCTMWSQSSRPPHFSSNFRLFFIITRELEGLGSCGCHHSKAQFLPRLHLEAEKGRSILWGRLNTMNKTHTPKSAKIEISVFLKILTSTQDFVCRFGISTIDLV